MDQFGWRAPLLDPGGTPYGGSTDLDIYLSSAGGGGAYCVPETPNGSTPNDDYSTYIVIDPSVPNIETYVAHEFNHSLQFAYDASEGGWIYEATATWMEDKVYDAVNDYTFFVSDFQAIPTRTLSFDTYNDYFMYGGAVFFHYLAEKYDGGGAALVRDIWEAAEEGANDWFDGLEATVLPNRAGAPQDLMSLYAEFAAYRWLSGSNSDGVWSDEAASWPEVPYGRRFTSLADASASGATVTTNPQKLGTSYIEVVTPDGVNGDRLTFTMNGETTTAWAVTVIGQKSSGAADVAIFRDDDSNGEIVARSDSNQQYSKVVFAVANLGVAGQNPDLNNGSGHSVDITPNTFTYDLFYSAEGGDPVDEPVACECNASRTTPTSGFVLLSLLGFAGVLIRRARG